MTFNEWFRTCNELDKESNELDCYLAWQSALRNNSGIKNHAGQKLLVQHILDTDEGLSENRRKILEELIK